MSSYRLLQLYYSRPCDAFRYLDSQQADLDIIQWLLSLSEFYD